jgi:hypothetical protein
MNEYRGIFRSISVNKSPFKGGNKGILRVLVSIMKGDCFLSACLLQARLRRARPALTLATTRTKYHCEEKSMNDEAIPLLYTELRT